MGVIKSAVLCKIRRKYRVKEVNYDGQRRIKVDRPLE